MYCADLVVRVKVHPEMPVFHRIHHVVVKDETLFFVTFALQTVCLNEHFNAFQVLYTRDRPHVVFVNDLFCHKVFDLQVSYSHNDSSF